MTAPSVVPLLLAVGFAPLLSGITSRTKAVMAGRVGQPLLQPYHDVLKLLRKGAVYSSTTTWVFRASPVVGLSAMIAATAFVPFGGARALAAFPGDVFVVVYLLALSRFFAVVAALDTGSSFEGMGASREVTFAALAEPALLLGLAAVARKTGNLALSSMYFGVTGEIWGEAAPALVLVVAALLVVFVAETGRIPVDDPATHLELTMVHEVMVLDHGGVDLAFILYAAALKAWLLGALVVDLVLPMHGGPPWRDATAATLGMIALAAATGLLESQMARLRLVHVPNLLVGATVLSVLALLLMVR